MATLQAATTSTGAIVSDPQAVRELCENYCFGTLNWKVMEEGELTIWGYDDFEVYEARENGLPDYDGGIVTHELLRRLTGYLEPDEELDIQTAGFTKCRSPVLAKRYVVCGDEVLHADLTGLDPIDPYLLVDPLRGVRGDSARASPREVTEDGTSRTRCVRTNRRHVHTPLLPLGRGEPQAQTSHLDGDAVRRR